MKSLHVDRNNSLSLKEKTKPIEIEIPSSKKKQSRRHSLNQIDYIRKSSTITPKTDKTKRLISYEPLRFNDTETVKKVISKINKESKEANLMRLTFQTELKPIEAISSKRKIKYRTLMMSEDEKKHRNGPRKVFIYSQGGAGSYVPAEDMLDVYEFDKIVRCNDDVTYKHRNQLAARYDPDLQYIKELNIKLPEKKQECSSLERVVMNDRLIDSLKSIRDNEERRMAIMLRDIGNKQKQYKDMQKWNERIVMERHRNHGKKQVTDENLNYE